MLCCAGLIGGTLVGQALGGPWTFIGPAAGFGIGLVADMKLMRRHQQKAASPDPQQNAEKNVAQAQGRGPAAESDSCCGVASGLTRVLGMKEKKEKREMTLAEIRKTYENGSTGLPVRGGPPSVG